MLKKWRKWWQQARCEHIFLVPRWSTNADKRKWQTKNCHCLRCDKRAEIRRQRRVALEAA